MKKFFLMNIMLLLSVVGMYAQVSIAEGVYKVFWEKDGRGYMCVNTTDYPTEPQLLDVTLSAHTNKHYQSKNDDVVNPHWYFIPSAKHKNAYYVFSLAEGKFLSFNTAVSATGGMACVLNDTPFPFVIEPSANSSAVGSYQIKTAYTYNNYDYYLCSGCGSQKNQHPVRWVVSGSANITSDGGFPLKLVANSSVTVDAAMLAAAQASVKKFEKYPVPGKTYYLCNINDTELYFNNLNGELKATPGNQKSAAYQFTCLMNGPYFQFQNKTGKFLAHKGLQEQGYNFELRTYTAQGEERIALYSVAAKKYFVIKNDGYLDQANDTYNAETTNYSTSYRFEERYVPEDGKNYYIYSDTYPNGVPVNRYLYADGNNLKMNTTLQLQEAYQWTCTVNDDGSMTFKNGAGMYLGYKTMSDNAYTFKVEDVNNHSPKAVTMYAQKDSRYIVVHNDGSKFNHSTITYDQETEAFCTDFVFVPVNEVNLLTISGDSKVKASATWNNETKALPASWVIFNGDPIVNPTLQVTPEAAYTLSGLYEGEENRGTTLHITTLNNHLTLKASFTTAFFSETFGKKWINIVRKTNANHAICLASNATNAQPTFVQKDYTNEGILWCFVGTADNFKIQNYVGGETLALTPSAETIGDGTEVKMVAVAEAKSWHLIEKNGGYAIAPVGNNDWSLNSYGGNSSLGKSIKFYGANDDGSQWNVDLIDTENTLTLGVSVDQVWASSPRIAELTFSVDGTSSQTRLTNAVDAMKYYLPKGVTLSLNSMTYRGYTFNEISGVKNLSSFSIPEGGLKLNLSYTANDERTLFYTPRDGHPYRIPAIATAPNGDIFAICDYRPCGNDIGYGEVDLVCRVSKDNGVTWSDEKCIADGLGHINNGIWKMGFGDPAIVADRKHNEVLVMSVCGNRTCWDGNYGEENENPNRVSRIRIKYNENTGEWIYSEPQEVTYDIYPKFKDSEGNVHAASLFIGAGKICQSRVVKKGKYYRLYCAVWNVTMTQRQHHNYVIYSDDFGETWNVLGELGYENCPSKYGNEPKCEELPDGTVVLSSRKYNGRYFNLFTFDDDTYTTGSWGQEASSNDVEGGLSFGGNSTNGEIYRVKAVRKSDQKVCDLMLQSIPTGSGRSDVAIYYKEMAYNEDGSNLYTPQTFSTGWTLGKQVSTKESCYSTMIMQADGRLGFFFEEAPGGYCMVYIPYTLEEVTGGLYGACKQNQTSFLLSDAHSVLQKTGVGYPKMESTTRTALKDAMKTFENSELDEAAVNELNNAITTYKQDGSSIQMPEDGKVYFICNVQKNGKTYMLSHEYDNAYLPEATEGAKDNTGNLFVCRTTENGYVLVNAQHGQYMLYHGINQTNPYETDGFSDTFSEKNVLKLHSQANDRFGTLSIAGKRNRNDNVNGFATMTINPEGNMNANSGENNSTYDNNYSSLFTFEEVTYANTPQLNTATGIEGIEAIATFSAPFATAIPEGVTAYYAESETEGVVNMTPVEGCIPADKGVLLTGATGRVTMVPALNETRPSMEGNLLRSSAGNARSISLEENAFILSKANGKVGFYALSKDESKRTIGMNKSYLVLPTGSQVSKLNFGGRPTDIETIEQNTNAQALIYDLSGRRVMKMVKGGIYIQNNKKFIAK